MQAGLCMTYVVTLAPRCFEPWPVSPDGSEALARLNSSDILTDNPFPPNLARIRPPDCRVAVSHASTPRRQPYPNRSPNRAQQIIYQHNFSTRITNLPAACRGTTLQGSSQGEHRRGITNNIQHTPWAGYGRPQALRQQAKQSRNNPHPPQYPYAPPPTRHLHRNCRRSPKHNHKKTTPTSTPLIPI